MNIALLTAAGIGSRMHQDIPKQFINVYDKPIIVYTLEAFQKHPDIDNIIVACLPGWTDILWAYVKQFNITKLNWIVEGGSTGQESIYKALCVLRDKCDVDDTILIHDGNRPMISHEVISNSIAVSKTYGDAVAAIPCTEAVFESEDGTSSSVSIPREKLWRTQTPHVYSLRKLLWAHGQANKMQIVNQTATCTLMNALGEKIHFSYGSEKNIKITTTEDIELFKALLDAKKDEWIK